MESSVEVLSEGEWSSLGGMYTTTEEANFMSQLLDGNNPPLNVELDSSSSLCSGLRSLDWHSSEETSFYTSSSASANFFSQIPNGSFHHHHESDHYLTLMNNPNTASNGRRLFIQSALVEEDKYLNHDEMMPQHMNNNNVELKEEEEMPKENIQNAFESSRKRSRSTGNIQKLKRAVKLKKTQSLEFSSQTEDYGGNFRAHKSTACCSDQEDSSLSQDPNGSAKESATLNLSGRTRASRGTATDPQSLYARKRRERINERLKVLQRLIPNGTKVDISTMLEEAVHYVKFLRLQIKLLSSDDLWMFAPIAYNGIDLGLDMRMNTLMR